MAKLTLSADGYLITATVSGLSSTHDRPRYYYWTVNGNKLNTTTDDVGDSSHTITLVGEYDTSYTVKVEICDTPAFGSDVFATLTETIKTPAAPSEPEIPENRPEDWGWWSTKAERREVKITANEWNHFTARINEFRAYKGLSPDSFTTAVSGETEISAAIVNQARTAIDAIDGHGTLPSAAVAGKPITAAFFNDLRDALNAIE